MGWEEIISAIALGAMILLLAPNAKQIVQQTRTANLDEWLSAIIPLVLVIGFVIFLIILVR